MRRTIPMLTALALGLALEACGEVCDGCLELGPCDEPSPKR